ncbi:hypothetical protein [Xanthobacter sp. YC-JY1]|uniref:VHL beta domain-containing protein n=1 Tax=Xanthobacter sp. YC-JY1 TaxID=2419844 RepID=UPI001F3D6DA2|nr:hypothetical protein [Xanthobacter sp. YC-JY1]UJX47076.1 hypothetical protein D7006_21800 [Xanthobacter sp. YC-JY1]
MTFKTRIFAGVLALSALGSSLPARAQETAYDRSGRWTITAVFDNNQFGYCAADIDNGQVQFRIGTDGRSWQIGVPFYGNTGPLDVYYGFGGAAEMGTFHAEGDGWASMMINNDQLNAFRTLPEFSVNLDRGEQTFKLAGAAQALDKTLACARNRGQKASPPPQPPQPPQQNVTNGKNCPPFGSVRSLNSNAPVKVMFVNESNIPLNIMWIDFNGEWKKYHTLRPHSNVEQPTYGTHPWIAVDSRGTCHGGVMYGNPASRTEGDNMFQIWD